MHVHAVLLHWYIAEPRGALNAPCLSQQPRCLTQFAACSQLGICQCITGYSTTDNLTCSQYLHSFIIGKSVTFGPRNFMTHRFSYLLTYLLTFPSSGHHRPLPIDYQLILLDDGGTCVCVCVCV